MLEKTSSLARSFGYLYQLEVVAIARYAMEYNLSSRTVVVVNIGAGAGTSGLLFAEVLPYAQRYTVDMSPGGPLGGLEGERNAFSEAGVYGLLPHQILGDSADVGRRWQNEPVDIIFIDGDHRTEGLTADINAWLPHVREGGLVIFHDYSDKVWGSVVEVVDKMMSKYTMLELVETTMFYEKTMKGEKHEQENEGNSDPGDLAVSDADDGVYSASG